MRAPLLTALVMALVFSAAPLVAAAQAANPAAPAAKPWDGWRLDLKTEEQSTYIRPAAPQGGYAQIWVGYEMEDPKAKGYASVAILMELDCAEGRARVRETTFYAKAGRVEPVQRNTKVTAWEYPEPLSDEDRYRLFMCEEGKPAPLSAFAAPVLAPWPTIDPLDWTVGPTVGETDRLFFKQGPRAEYARLWLRVEYRQPFEGESSTVYLYESDCKLSKVRQLQSSSYAGNNLQRPITTDSTPTPWLFAPPGSFDEVVLSLSCPRVEAPKTAV